MQSLTDVPADLADVHRTLAAALERVAACLDAQLASDLPPVSRLCSHVARYRGKMLRPSLVLLAGLACEPAAPADNLADPIADEHVALAAVCELVHMATLVHDDVLDDADTRRQAPTINHLAGNEAAVILGDYLIAAAFHLCATLDSQEATRLVGAVSMSMCAGELLQLHHRDDFALDEPTYLDIVQRKTAGLISLACELGAAASGADSATRQRLARFGLHAGIAFQIRDDLLDLCADADTLGKPVHQDLGKGKLTLPVIHHLAAVPPGERDATLALLAQASRTRADPAAARHLLARLERSGSVEYARAAADRAVRHAKAVLWDLPDTPARRFLLHLADRIVARSY